MCIVISKQCEELSADKKKIDPCEIASKLNWNAFAKLRSSSSSSTKHKDLTNAMKQLYLQLLLHLQVKMHMFRHEGERDWVNYFKNRPYNDSAPSHCGIRSSFEVRDTFPGYINYVLCMYLRTYAFMYVCICTVPFPCMRACMYVCMYVCCY